jgi:hypothetical protein
MTIQEKQPHEMSWAELKNCSSQLAGLPAPRDDAPRTEWHKWADKLPSRLRVILVTNANA